MNAFILECLIEGGIDAELLQIDNLIEPIPEIEQLVQGNRRGSKKSRNQNYFEVIVPMYSDGQFKEHFRMSRNTFAELLNIVGHHVGLDELNANIDLTKKLLFSIWLLAKPESFLAVGDRFNIPTSSGHSIFKSIVNVLSELMPRYVQWPNAAQQATSSQIFEERSRGISNVVGAIDGCHIPIKQPEGNATDYFNRKQFHSIILQGVCDHSMRFIDVFIGMPGRIHDAHAFRKSELFQKMTNQQNPLLQRRQHLIGDCAYPLMVNLMTPFRDNGHLTVAQKRYNSKLSSIRSIIERAFGLLKVKFRRLKYLDIKDVDFGNNIISASCMLHNFMIDNGEIDIFNEELNDDMPAVNAFERCVFEDRLRAQDAVNKRMHIVHNL